MDKVYIVTVKDRPDELVETAVCLSDTVLPLIPSVAKELEVAVYQKVRVLTSEEIKEIMDFEKSSERDE